MTMRNNKLGYVLKRFPRVSETFILNEILELERGGAALEIFSLLEPEAGLRHGALTQVRSPVTYLPQSAVLKDLSVLAGRFSSGTFEPQPLKDAVEGESYKNDLFRYLQAAALAVLARSRSVGHLHAHFGTDATTVAMLANRMTGIPYSFTAHAKDIYHEDVDQSALREKIRRARFVITVSDYNRAHLATMASAADAQKINRLYNGIDLEQFQPARAVQREPSLILGVGRLVEKKGFHDLISACAHLQRNGIAFQCLIVGDGPERNKLAGIIAELNLQHSVSLIGSMSQEELIGILNRATLFVLPCIVSESTGDRDGLPTVLLEALAVGLPAISTNVAGIPEIISQEKTGLLVAPNDPLSLASAIAQLHADPQRRELMARQGRSKALRDFDLRKNVPALWGHFAQSMALYEQDGGGARAVNEMAGSDPLFSGRRSALLTGDMNNGGNFCKP